MKNKKLLSTILAATLAATTMAMPVMAAQRGSVDVEVEDEKGVLRVEVPTMLTVKIDPYEIAQKGCQIASTEFPMTNRSQMAVKVDMKSQITKDVGSDLSFVSSKEGATASTTKGEAWVAIAAMTSGDPASRGMYDDPSTSGDPETVATLQETNKNVTTFSASGDAEQTYYLEKASGDAANLTITYKKVVPAEDGKTGTEFAEYYELKEKTFANTGASGDAELEAAVKSGDVYRAASGDPVDTLRKYTKESSISGDVKSGDVFYTISGDAKIGIDQTKAGKTYMYQETEKGGQAGFRYIGNLSNADAKEWSKDDFGTISLTYTITGVSKTVYDSVAEDLVKGFYTKAKGPQVSLSTSGVISFSNLDGSKYQSMVLNDGTKDWPLVTDVDGTWLAWDAEESGSKEFKLSDSWMGYLPGKTAVIKVTLSDGSIQSGAVRFPAS